MKIILGFAAALISFGGMNARAESQMLSCSNGTIDQVGDQHFQIDLLEDGLSILPYEGSIPVDAAQLDYDQSKATISILNQTLEQTSEGVKSQRVITAILIYNPNKLNVAISYDRGPFHSYELDCVVK